jgi:hypothetical protein
VPLCLREDDAQRDAVNGDPLKKAWIWSLRDLVEYHEPSGGWYVRPLVYWSLFERYKEASWADELAWVASQHVTLGDECDLPCALRLIVDGPLQYWTRFPRGAHVDEALERATGLASAARDSDCDDVTSTRQESRAARAVVQALIVSIRNSFGGIQAAATRDLIESLDDATRRCVK